MGLRTEGFVMIKMNCPPDLEYAFYNPLCAGIRLKRKLFLAGGAKHFGRLALKRSQQAVGGVQKGERH
jgi:hypothetical protein